MKKVILVIVIMFAIASLASAEFLTTANPIGKGKFAFLGAGIQDQTYQNISGASLTNLGGYAGYGITDQLDGYLQAGMANTSGYSVATGIPQLPTVTLDIAAIGYGANLKYTILNEGNGLPISVAVGGGYKIMSSTVKVPEIKIGNTVVAAASQSTKSGSQMMAGVGVSKMLIPFIPYGGIAYRSNTYDGQDQSTQLDLTVGTAVAWSTQGAVLAEYTLQSITPKVGSNYSSGQMAASVAYKL